MPENKPMKMQWVTIDGQSVPMVLPQVWNPDINDWEVTGSNKPLPTQDDLLLNKLDEIDRKVDGIIDGTTPANTQLTGSNVDIVTEDIELDELESGQSQTIYIEPDTPRQLLLINRFRMKTDSIDNGVGWGRFDMFLNYTADFSRNRIVRIESSSEAFLAIYPTLTSWEPRVLEPAFGMEDGKYTMAWYEYLKTIHFSKETPLIIRITNNSDGTMIAQERLRLICKEVF